MAACMISPLVAALMMRAAPLPGAALSTNYGQRAFSLPRMVLSTSDATVTRDSPHRFGRGRLVSAAAAAGAATVLGAAAPRVRADEPEVSGSWTVHTGPFDADFFSGFTETDSGIAYKKVRPGSGEKPVAGQKVFMQYAGYLLDGKRFDSTYDGNRGSFAFRLGKGKVISGWEATASGMQSGMRVIVRIPPKYAYGGQGAGGVIPPDATLVFYMELVGLGSIKP